MRTSNLLIATLLLVALVLPAVADYPMFGLDPGRTGNASGYAPVTDNLIWSTDVSSGSGGYIGCGASVVSGRVYVSNWPTMIGGAGLGLHCLDESDGSIIWDNPMGGSGGVSTPAIAGDKVFAGDYLGDLYCMDVNDGTTNWNTSVEPNPTYWGLASSPLIYDGMVYVVSFSDGTMHAIDFDGVEQWNYSASGVSDAYMSVATDGSNLFFGGGNAMNCVDIATQTAAWAFAVGDKVTTTPAACDGVVYFATGKNEKKLYAVDIATGTEIWNRSLYGSLSSPAISDGKIYIGDKDKQINCICASNGTTLWTQTLGGACLSSPVVANGMVYTTANYDDGTIYGFDAGDGTLKWSYDTGNWNMAQPSVSDGILFVGSDTGYLYAFSNMAWDGEVDLTPGTVNVTADNSGEEYTISSTCAMYATIRAAETGGFNYSISDAWYDDFDGALYFDMIYDRHESGFDGWLYRVNYPEGSQPPSPNLCELEDGDVMIWYWGVGMGALPEDSDMLIRIRVSVATATASDWTQFHCDIANTGNSPADAPDTNHTKWISADINASEASQATIVGDCVFAYISEDGADDAVSALDRATGDVIWRTTFPGETKDWGSSTTPAYADGVVFVAAGYNVTRFDAATGEKLQETTFSDGGYLNNGGVTVADGVVFVGSGDGANYYALNASDLDDAVWSYAPNLTRAYSVPAVADDRVVFGDAGWGFDDGYLYCVDELTGTEVWSTELTGLVWGSAAIDAANNRVYVGTAVDWATDQGRLFALEFDTGDIAWSAEIRYTSGTPAISGEYIYISASGEAPGVTYCFDRTGTPQWNVSSGSRQISPAVADGKLFTGDVGTGGMSSVDAEGIYAYDAATGALIWQYECAGSSPSVAEDADGSSIVVSIGADGKVYAFTDIVTGDLNHDGTITPADAAIALQIAVRGEWLEAADMNCDGMVTSLDALMILQNTIGG
ncbi:MAG: outer membrane protein assembly factor BamB family protein [Candidatus Methanogasteraceae archaeon]